MKKSLSNSASLIDDSLYSSKHYAPATAEENRELFSRYKVGDRDAYQEMIFRNMGLVYSIVKRYEDVLQSYAFSDLVQEGIIGLMEAIEGYDPEKGTFSTYASPRIFKYVMEALQKYDKMIKRPKYIFELNSKYHKILSEKSTRGLVVDDSEIVDKLGISASLYSTIKSDVLYNPESLNSPILGYEDIELGESLPSKRDELGDLLDTMSDDELFLYLKKSLSNYEYYVLYYRVFSEKKMTKEELANKFGVTKTTITHTLLSVLRRLRNIYMSKGGITTYFIRALDENVDVNNIARSPIEPNILMRYLFVRESLDDRTRVLYKEWIFRTNDYDAKYYADRFGITYEDLITSVKTIKSAIEAIDPNKFERFKAKMVSTYKIELLDIDVEKIEFSKKPSL